ncbi:DUF3006 domain-containing protein [Natronomonas sp.]|uniref:DUF3006 domain-containing protein n=1 Tax=Natronomonas sp. TaxID=2184060 RepID=UPI002FC392ED
MTLNGTYTATVDRIEEGQAVFLIEDDGETIDDRNYPASDLPEGVEEGMVCEVTFDEGALVAIEPQPETTADRRERIREKFDRLSKRLRDE